MSVVPEVTLKMGRLLNTVFLRGTFGGVYGSLIEKSTVLEEVQHLLKSPVTPGSKDRWRESHARGYVNPMPGTHEMAMVLLITGIEIYALAYARDCGDEPGDTWIGDDGVLGSALREIMDGVLGLLNGELVRLDGGTLNSYIRTIASAHKVTLDP